MSMARKALQEVGEAGTKVKDAIDRATSGPRLRPADRGKRPQAGPGQTDGQGNDARPGRPEQRRPRPPGEVGGRGAAPRTTSPDH